MSATKNQMMRCDIGLFAGIKATGNSDLRALVRRGSTHGQSKDFSHTLSKAMKTFGRLEDMIRLLQPIEQAAMDEQFVITNAGKALICLIPIDALAPVKTGYFGFFMKYIAAP